MSQDTIKTNAAYIWSIAEILRGDFKQSEYGKIVLPFTVLRRLDCLLESTKKAVLDTAATLPAETDDEARALLRSLADAYPTLSGPLTNLGILEARGNQQQIALQHFREAVRTNPENAVAHNWLGILYREQGDYARAEEAYRSAIALRPDYAIAYRNLGVLYDVYLERPEAALAAYRAYLERSPEDDLIVRVWVRELEARGISAPPRSLAITGAGT